ncbi:MAG: 50S ribosomal protein L1 [Deltaproteobacteria bacterium]|nr:50S ribosomal protein L1 [Deltaproteobacteria bacterium]
MSRRGKKYRNLCKEMDLTKVYPLSDAVELAKKASYSKFGGSLDLAVNLGVDPRHADQNVRGACPLPHGLGKEVRIVVFAKGQKAVEASEAGVEFVGADDLAEKIQAGWLDFDQVVATPDMMAVVGKLGRVLGPRGLMPNPKLGTVTFDVVEAIRQMKAGRVEYRVDKAGIVHASVGKLSMDSDKLLGNIEAVVESLIKAKPSTAKGTYLKRMAVSPTMGPGIKVDPQPFR